MNNRIINLNDPIHNQPQIPEGYVRIIPANGQEPFLRRVYYLNGFPIIDNTPEPQADLDNMRMQGGKKNVKRKSRKKTSKRRKETSKRRKETSKRKSRKRN